MKITRHPMDTGKRLRSGIGINAVLSLLALSLALPGVADDQPTLSETARARVAENSTAAGCTVDSGESGAPSADGLSDQWGIEVTSIRLTAHDHMIDFRYRVLDAAKAKELFVRQNKPRLIHQDTGKVLAVPETAKIGPLRNSNEPKQGKIYWMFFGNASDLVQRGDKVTVVIGEFQVDDLVVE